MKAVFAPQYFGSIYYFASLFRCKEAFIDIGLRYDKRFKSVHRTDIVDTRGRLTLTVPVSRPDCAPLRQWSQVRVSSHGAWWHTHLVSLESAYGRTPYFEFYIDRFKPWLCDTNALVTDFDRGLTEVLCRTLLVPAQINYVDFGNIPRDVSVIDLRHNNFSELKDVEYYQVRADRLGFIPGLSILDLLFNMGPEAPLILQKMSAYRINR